MKTAAKTMVKPAGGEDMPVLPLLPPMYLSIYVPSYHMYVRLYYIKGSLILMLCYVCILFFPSLDTAN